MRIVFVNKRAALEGGCERAIASTVAMLERTYQFKSILLYELGSRLERPFTQHFAGVFPVVDLQAQLEQLAPDAVFVHRASTEWLETIARLTHLRRVAFVHDHDSLCLRRHKLTIRGTSPCTKTPGIACALRCGPVQRGPQGLEVRSPFNVSRAHKALTAMDAVIAPSQYLLSLLRDVGIPADRLHRLAPYTELPPARDPRRVVSNRLLFVGALTRGKGVGQLLEALAQLERDVHLNLLGEGPQREQFVQQAAGLGISERVRFFGKVDQTIVFEQLEQAALLVMPSIAPETFGLVGAEALAAQVPVVGTRAGGVRDWLCDGMTGQVVAAGDVQALAEAIASSLSNPARSATRAVRGRKRVLELINEESQLRVLGGLLGLSAHVHREVA